MNRCPSCRAAVREGDKYCSFCMTPLLARDLAHEGASAPPPPAPIAEQQPLERGDQALLRVGSACWGGEPVLHTEGLKHLTSIAAWRVDGDWALMTMGLTALDLRPYVYELSGEGYELTMRVAGDKVPTQALQLLDRLAAEKPTKKKLSIKGLPPVTLTSDPQLAGLDTANGRVEFRRVVPHKAEPAATFDPAALRPEPTALDRLKEKDSRPAFGIRFDANATARSHRGGSATVPDGFEWPRCRGIPLPLLLEVDLAECPLPGWLPSSGRLLLFGLHDDTDARVSVLLEGRKSWNEVFVLRLVDGSGAPRSAGVQLPHEGLTLTPFTDAPNWRWPPIHALLKKLDKDDTGKPLEDYNEACRSGFPNQLLGHSHSVQDEAIVGALKELGHDGSYSKLVRAAMEWAPLLQLESDGPWNFCGGRLFVVGPRDAIAQGRFEELRAVLQC
ncbi:MAG: DUF1963 domain-containing protein [Myxococcales bacterium]|nr:DUF1963 domain-containing protein [Myxococcales bacterium]